MTASIIDFKNVNLVYPNKFHALKNINLNVKPGEFVAVIGRSGAGKSTLLRAINKTIPVTSGNAQVLGQNLLSCEGGNLRNLRSKIGFIFQQFNLVKNLTALQNVLHGRLATVGLLRSLLGFFPAGDIKAAKDALNSVGLDTKYSSRVDALSGGQQQRVAIARCLVQGAKIILADEPIASLDPESARKVMELLVDLNQLEFLLHYFVILTYAYLIKILSSFFL
jgi:phosphonate transport system ATP-binding protein